LKSGADGLRAQASVMVDNGDVTAMLPPAARPPLTGRLKLQAEIEGSGRSPVALVGSLHGAGNISLTGGQFSGLDPRAFGAVTKAVDQGLPVEGGKIEKLAGNALDSGQLTIKQADGELTINAGQIRLANAKASGEGADLSLSGALDLTNGTLDARLVLTGTDTAAGARPDLFVALHGPLDAPVKTIDVSALTGWLTLRAIDAQAKKLDAIESSAKPESPAESPSPMPPAPLFPPRQAVPAKPKESSVVKRPPATARQPEQAPALPPPINILPFINAPEPPQVLPRHSKPMPRTGASISPQN
jgi:uncharacterized protein involved in outer membrane biogenesis